MYVLNTYYLPDTVLGSEDKLVNKTNRKQIEKATVFLLCVSGGDGGGRGEVRGMSRAGIKPSKQRQNFVIEHKMQRGHR